MRQPGAPLLQHSITLPCSSLALDLGTSQIKAAVHGPDGLGLVTSLPAPALSGGGLFREGNAEHYFEVADELLRTLEVSVDASVPLGVASQRSSFLLWDRSSGNPLTPLISWQDRRAESWCRKHGEWNEGIVALTGLPLSPHYAGPKLAVLLERNGELRRMARAGECLFGTLETYLVWRWTRGAVHETDLSMAARTLMVSLRTADWSNDLLERFGIPEPILPRIARTFPRNVSTPRGRRVAVTVADQAAAAMAVVGENEVLVNLGTGGFVVCPCGVEFRAIPRYLCGPLFLGERGATYAMEGTINGIGPALQQVGSGADSFPRQDPTPDAFCLPDSSGVGSPHWKAGVPMTFSRHDLPPADRSRVFLEGVGFRVREILEDLESHTGRRHVLVSGGMMRETSAATALAGCLGRSIRVVDVMDATLLGAARLAAGLPPYSSPSAREVVAAEEGRYLFEKFGRWREWVREQVLR